jgi:hypothetical protein
MRSNVLSDDAARGTVRADTVECSLRTNNRSGDVALSTKLVQDLRNRIATLTRWLERHCPNCETEQAHLDPGTREQAYWNYGYLVALRDMLKKLGGGTRA